jgi:hypothetical protein
MYLVATSDDGDTDYVHDGSFVAGTTYKMCADYHFTGDVFTVYIDTTLNHCTTSVNLEADGAGDYVAHPSGTGGIDGVVLFGYYASGPICMDVIFDDFTVETL